MEYGWVESTKDFEREDTDEIAYGMDPLSWIPEDDQENMSNLSNQDSCLLKPSSSLASKSHHPQIIDEDVEIFK